MGTEALVGEGGPCVVAHADLRRDAIAFDALDDAKTVHGVKTGRVVCVAAKDVRHLSNRETTKAEASSDFVVRLGRDDAHGLALLGRRGAPLVAQKAHHVAIMGGGSEGRVCTGGRAFDGAEYAGVRVVTHSRETHASLRDHELVGPANGDPCSFDQRIRCASLQ